MFAGARNFPRAVGGGRRPTLVLGVGLLEKRWGMRGNVRLAGADDGDLRNSLWQCDGTVLLRRPSSDLSLGLGLGLGFIGFAASRFSLPRLVLQYCTLSGPKSRRVVRRRHRLLAARHESTGGGVDPYVSGHPAEISLTLARLDRVRPVPARPRVGRPGVGATTATVSAQETTQIRVRVQVGVGASNLPRRPRCYVPIPSPVLWPPTAPRSTKAEAGFEPLR